jgi:hypothetical protein
MGIGAALSLISSIIHDYGERVHQLAEARDAIDRVERSTLAVMPGERKLLDELDDKLHRAREILPQLGNRSADGGKGRMEQLREVRALFDDFSWELLGDVRATAEAKAAEIEQTLRQQEEARTAEDERIRQHTANLQQWKTNLNTLRIELARARSEWVPLVEEERQLLQLESRIGRIERALADRNYDDLAAGATEVAAQMADQPTRVAGIRRHIEERRPYVRQADLLILRAPDDKEQSFTYTVLLRTPSQGRSHGINIQGESTVIKPDRAFMQSLFGKVTDAVNHGVARSHQRRTAGAAAEAPAPPAATPAPAAAASAAAAVAGAPAGAVAAALGPVDAAAVPDLTGPAGPPTVMNAEERALRYLFYDRAKGTPPLECKVEDLLRHVGDLMYRLFIPDEMQRYLRETPCSLTLTTNDLELPWELMMMGDEFLCLNRPVARLPMGTSFPRRAETVERAKRRFLLIYADPDRNLANAAREIDHIKATLEKDWKDDIEVEVFRLEDASTERLNGVLRHDRYDVIHYAGHAAFNPRRPELSGLLLEQREVFFAQKIRRLLRGGPLVFLNACESGTTANEKAPQQVSFELSGPAEGLASAFIYGGARGCVGSVWPVYDDGAAAFAAGFYHRLLKGEMIGEALRLARIESRKQMDDQVTWAAFVLYGDPTFRLVE